MDLRRVQHPDSAAAVVRVTGDIDNFTAPELRDELLDAHRGGARLVVVDLTDTDFLDSSALGALVGVHKTLLSDDGVLRVVCTKPHLRRVFEITRMTEVVPMFDSVDSALN